MSSQNKNPKLKHVFNWGLDLNKHGSVVDMSEITAGGQNILAFATSKGHLCGLDLRCKELAWDLENDPKYGWLLFLFFSVTCISKGSPRLFCNYHAPCFHQLRFNALNGSGPIPVLVGIGNQSGLPHSMGYAVSTPNKKLAARRT